MEKKYKIIILILMILVVGGSIVYYYQSTENVLQVGDVKFKVPNEYKIGELNVEGNPTITDGVNSIYFTYYDDTNISKIVKNYTKERESQNITIVQSNFTVNNLMVYKTYSNQGASHYWFLFNGKTYSIYTWKETFNIDNIVSNLISSISLS